MTCDDNLTCPEDYCLKHCKCYSFSSSECQPQPQSPNNHSLPYIITGVVIFVVLIVILSLAIWQHLKKKKRENLAGLQIRQHNIRAIQNAITQMEAANQSTIGLVIGPIDQGIPCPQENLSICVTGPMNISGAEDASPDSYQVSSNIPFEKETGIEKDRISEDMMRNIAQIKTRDYATGEFADIHVEQILNKM